MASNLTNIANPMLIDPRAQPASSAIERTSTISRYPTWAGVTAAARTIGGSAQLEQDIDASAEVQDSQGHVAALQPPIINNGAERDDTAAWQLQQTLEGHTGFVTSVAFSHDSKFLASGSVDYNIRVWDTATWQLQQTLEGHNRSVRSVAFSRDSKFLASGSDDLTIRVWDTATWQLQQTLEGYNNPILSVAFSHDSKFLASGSGDRTIRVWDIATWQPQQTLKGHTGFVSSVAFSHDSKFLASGSYGCTSIHIYILS